MARQPKPKRPPRKNKGGRPPALTVNGQLGEWTLKTIAGLGKVVATTKECAAVLGVSEPTFIAFMKANSKAREAYDNSRGDRFVSLRRQQFKVADQGNATMLIWLGKQHLGQRDVDREHLPLGGGGPIIDVSTLSDEEVDSLVAILRKLAGEPGQGDAADPGGRAITQAR